MRFNVIHVYGLNAEAVRKFESAFPERKIREPNLIITPHVAGLVPGYLDRVLKIFIDNMKRLEDGKPLINEIDRARGY